MTLCGVASSCCVVMWGCVVPHDFVWCSVVLCGVGVLCDSVCCFVLLFLFPLESPGRGYVVISVPKIVWVTHPSPDMARVKQPFQIP